jgi:hypothetical protein
MMPPEAKTIMAAARFKVQCRSRPPRPANAGDESSADIDIGRIVGHA